MYIVDHKEYPYMCEGKLFPTPVLHSGSLGPLVVLARGTCTCT